MDTSTCATDAIVTIRSAMTAARTRVGWPRTSVDLAPVFARPGHSCVQPMSCGHDGSLGHDGSFPGSVNQGYAAKRELVDGHVMGAFVTTSFPTRSGPPL